MALIRKGRGNCNVLPANVMKYFSVKLCELLLGKDYRAQSFNFPEGRNFLCKYEIIIMTNVFRIEVLQDSEDEKPDESYSYILVC